MVKSERGEKVKKLCLGGGSSRRLKLMFVRTLTSFLLNEILQIQRRRRGGWGEEGHGGDTERHREEAGGAAGGVQVPGHLQRAPAGGGGTQQQLPQGNPPTHIDTPPITPIKREQLSCVGGSSPAALH